MMRDRVLIGIGSLYSLAALAAAYQGHGTLALGAVLALLAAMNLWMSPRRRLGSRYERDRKGPA